MEARRKRHRLPVSYHLLYDGLTLRDADGATLFAHAVGCTLSGLVTHADYVGAAQRAAGVLSGATFTRQLRLAIAVDVNPLVALFPPSLGAMAFETRWNALNEAAEFGVKTSVEGLGGEGRAIHRVAEPGSRDEAFRAELMHRLLESMSSRCRDDRADDGRVLLSLFADLGPRDSAIRDVLERLHEEPGTRIDECAASAGVSLRTLQRQLGRHELRFAVLRQAAHLSIAGHRMRTRDESLTDTAMYAGFFDSAHMIHAWQRACGISPSIYRSIARLSVGTCELASNQYSGFSPAAGTEVGVPGVPT